jgi:hypothetical protein
MTKEQWLKQGREKEGCVRVLRLCQEPYLLTMRTEAPLPHTHSTADVGQPCSTIFTTGKLCFSSVRDCKRAR